MKLSEHEYLIPILLGRSRLNLKYAVLLRKQNGAKSHLFAEHFGLRERLLLHCHRIKWTREEFLAEYLIAFAISLEEYYCPVLVLCDEAGERFALEHGERLEPYMLIRRAEELF